MFYAQQVAGYGREGDVLLGISTSGNSRNVLYAAVAAKARGMKVIGLTGSRENRLLAECIESGRDFVVDNTNPTRADRARYISAAKSAGYTVTGYYFRSSIGESLERNAARTGKARVPDVAVAATHAKLELPSHAEGFDELYYVHIWDGGFVADKWESEGKT